MTEVITIKFKSCGKNYYFAPGGIEAKPGDMLIVETAKGLELAECARGNRMVEDTAVVQPLRPIVRKATAVDLRANEENKAREKEAFDICLKKIAEHELDMKLVNVECSFDGGKITFFFTSDGRVDFRELVKDLASIFHNRIELRQIGVRDEAKMIGGIGICGRPYCCSQFLNDFAPVSTKMAKVQSLSLNPTKISGSCGRLMCCLRYEEDAYEELIKTVPKQGAFVETVDGYGAVASVDLLHQTVKVRLDNDAPENLHLYKANEVAAVPGGRPKDGEEPAHVLNYISGEEEIVEAEEDSWDMPGLFADNPQELITVEAGDGQEESGKPKPEKKNNNRRRGSKSNKNRNPQKPDAPKADAGKAETKEKPASRKQQPKPENGKKPENEGNNTGSQGKSKKNKRRYYRNSNKKPNNAGN